MELSALCLAVDVLYKVSDNGAVCEGGTSSFLVVEEKESRVKNK